MGHNTANMIAVIQNNKLINDKNMRDRTYP